MKVLRFFNAIMTLGRVSNLPSVWSNCLAAWVLSGGQLSSSIEIEKFILLNFLIKRKIKHYDYIIK